MVDVFVGMEHTVQSYVFRTRQRWSHGQHGPGLPWTPKVPGCLILSALLVAACSRNLLLPAVILVTPTFCYATPPPSVWFDRQLKNCESKLPALYKSLSEVFEDCNVHWYVYAVYVGSKLHLGARTVWKIWVIPKSSWMDKNPVCFQLPLSLFFGSCLAHWEVKPRGLLGGEPQCLDVFVLKIKLSGSLRRKLQLNKDLCLKETKKWC